MISQILTDYIAPPKNHMQVLENHELDVIFEYMTQHNQAVPECRGFFPHTVKKGQTIIILEAMKMENNINADKDGKITAINVNKGDSVLEGNDLVIIE